MAKRNRRKRLNFSTRFGQLLARINPGKLLVGLGLILVLAGGVGQIKAQDVSFNVQPATIESTIGARPVRLVVPKVNIDLEVTEASISAGNWQLSPTGASHLNSSSMLGGGGNIVVYGHNWPSLLAPLKQIKIGDEITLKGENGLEYNYVVKVIEVVEPTQIEYVLPSEEEKLTLYTCTGWNDKQRLVVVGERV